MEQYKEFKALERNLNEMPKVKPEAHFVLNDISEKILLNKELSEKEINQLELIHSELQDLNRNLLSIFDDYRSRNVIGREEYLVVANYFLIAEQVGPQSIILAELFGKNLCNEAEYETATAGISIPVHIKKLLARIYSKMVNQ